MIFNVRGQVRRQAMLAVKNVKDFTYDEVRPLPVSLKPIVRSDCSFFVKLMYWVAGAPDPMKTGFNEWGNSVTLFEQGKKIPLSKVKVGDVVVWGPNGESHAAIFVQPGKTLLQDGNPLLVSMGRPGSPEFVKLNDCTQGVKNAGEAYEPVTFLRFSCVNRRWLPYRRPTAPPVAPSTAVAQNDAPRPTTVFLKGPQA